ncbi:MAG TPA: EAL domain-containing protein [Acidimicrobiales bacterium]|nr:EAL domain-containing protein [Acidimicrobiales bacterium]
MWFNPRSWRAREYRGPRRTDDLHYLALHDPLTGLANRALIMDRAEHMLARSRRERTPLAALFLDLDDFKDINDTLGHRAGDGVLVHVSKRIAASVRESDTVGRLGGDEFIVLVEGDSLADGVEPLANRILEIVRAPMSIPESDDLVEASASIGIATGERPAAEDLLRDADIALYRAKTAGKRQFVVFEPEMEMAVRERRHLELGLRRALAAEEFFLVYRPSPRAATDGACGLEALLRWRHPTRGVLEPPQFLSELENCGLIVPVGRWVLETACRQAARWHDLDHRFTISVAVSPRQLERPTFLDDVRSILGATALPPALLMLEIAEAALLSDDVTLPRRLQALRDLGVRLAAVDPGYASIANLRRFPVDTVKIDRPVPEDLAPTKEAQAFIVALMQLGAALGLEIVGDEPALNTTRRPEMGKSDAGERAPVLESEEVEAFLAGFDEQGPGNRDRMTEAS